ncbi:hypothetical protein UPYG_G00322030 [Umbra pygmaea]|uniref:Multimerin-2 n=1 Tax=Umbra pygmaea TaxID=75934 RepID=A0ABD0W2C8_UMBPY
MADLEMTQILWAAKETDMTAVGELMLMVLGLMVTAHCEVRARDPEVEEEEPGMAVERRGWDTQEMGVGVPAGPGGFDIPYRRTGPHGHRHDMTGTAHQTESHGARRQAHLAGAGKQSLGLASEETPPPPGKEGNFPARTGNWCAFVHYSTVTVAVVCGTEQYTIRAQSPCPNGTPDCQLIMYKLSTRPVYREKKNVITALLWRCCPGHAGPNCEETVAGGQVLNSQDPPLAGPTHAENIEAQNTDAQSHQPEWEQNDFQASEKPLDDPLEADSIETHTDSPESLSYPRQAQEHIPHAGYDHPHHPHQKISNHGDPVRHPDTQSPLTLPHMMALLMVQIQPMLDGFNRTLEHLTREVGTLSRDVAQLQSSQWNVEALHGASVGVGPEDLESKLNQSLQDIKDVKRELEQQRAEMADRLHSQHAMLHYNITNIKTDVDMKIKRNHKMLQVHLQSLNATISDMKLEQERLGDALQGILTSHDMMEPSQAQPSLAQPLLDESAVWEAIARLDTKVVNNTLMVDALVEDLEMANNHVMDLKKGFRGLEENIAQTGRNSQIQFMETGLEVEAAKVTVLNRVNELASNLTICSDQLKELDSDLDYVYTHFYKNVSAGCDCQAFTSILFHLEQGLKNVTELVNENRQAVDGTYGAGSERWGLSVEDIYQGLDDVKASLAFEQEKSRTLHENVTRLLASAQSSQKDVITLRESDERLAVEMRHLSSSFSSLLKDAIRHTDVLETLLGEEVIEFMDWPLRNQQAYSIPVLQETLSKMQEQIRDQNVSLTSLLEVTRAEDTASDEPSVLADWASHGLERSGARRSIHLMDPAAEQRLDYSDSDPWSLQKAVEDLGVKVSRLENRSCPASCNSTKGGASGGVEVKLQAEVVQLRRGLEDHLKLFKNVFSNLDGLADSESTLDLDQMWALMKRKEGKRQKKQKDKTQSGQQKYQAGEGVKLRSRRDTQVLSQLMASPLFLVSNIQRSIPGDSRLLVFEDTSINRAQAYSTTNGVFQAPLTGVYLFLLTLNFKPGPSLSGLRSVSGDLVATLHQDKMSSLGRVTGTCLLQLRRGEELYLELSQGTLAIDDPKGNIFAGFLMYHAT